MTINLPRSAQYALKSLLGAGYQAYIVGGSVRDVLLGKEPNDYDITTSALPDEVMALFKKDHLLTNGLKHGTITLIKYGEPIEITTFRIDGEYEDGRHPDDVVFTGNLYEDVQRRDFTINALCWNDRSGLIDYVDGQDDLENRVVRCVGEPDVRFNEDALRILRAIRFSAVLDFDIDEATALSIHKNAALLEKIAVERILTELKKLLCGPRAESILLEYRDVFEVFMPELNELSADDYLLAARRVTLVSPAPELRLAALLCDLPVQKALDCTARLKVSKAARKFIEGIILNGSKPIPTDRVAMRHALRDYGAELLTGLTEIAAARAKALCCMVIQQNDCVTLRQLALNGNDVFLLGVTRRNTGLCLNTLLEKVIAGELPNEKQALTQAVLEDLQIRSDKQTARKARRKHKKEEAALIESFDSSEKSGEQP